MQLRTVVIALLHLSVGALWADVEKIEFGGTGMQLQESGGLPVVVAVIPQGPAALGGVQPGDRLVAVDGQPLEGLSLDHAVELLRGAQGTLFELKLLRSGEELQLLLTRTNLSYKRVRCAEVRERRGERAKVGDVRDHLGEDRKAYMTIDGLSLGDAEQIPERAGWGYSVRLKETREGDDQQKSALRKRRAHLSSADGRLWNADPGVHQTTPLLGQ